MLQAAPSAGGILLQAGLSHLDLALVNISEQAHHHEFSADQITQLCDIITKLQTLATRREKENKMTVVSLDSMLSHDDPEVLLAKGIDGEMRTQMEAVQDNTDRDSPRASAIDAGIEVNDMLTIMTEAFRELSHGESLAVQWNKLHSLSINIGLRGPIVETIFHATGKTHDGLVFEEEWISLAKEMLVLHERTEIIDMIKSARQRKMQGHGLSYDRHRTGIALKTNISSRLILSCKSRTRVVWDLCMLALLIYVAFALPLTLGFDDLHTLQQIDLVVDWIFFFDVFLNFRTTYINHLREEEWEWKAIAKNYLKSWFTLDFISSCPLEQLSNGLFPRMQSAKLLKFGKMVKSTKVFRLGKVMKMMAGSEVMDLIEEFVWSRNLSVIGSIFLVFLQLVICGHWSACLMLACNGGAVDAYLGHSSYGLQKYLVALYWAITTMTTVGYGDVTMKSELERLYAIIAMMAGGAFYGYIIGLVTSIVASRSRDHDAFRERMDAVGYWLNHHYELPSGLRRRVWRHFKEFLTAKRAVEDSVVLNDLPTKLCNEVSEALLKGSVRHNPLFQNLSIRAVSALTGVLVELKLLANETIVCEGDLGVGMFIVDRGFVNLTKPMSDRIERLGVGASFGVEILLREVSHYAYTVKSHSKVCLYKLLRVDFVNIFKDDMHQDLMTILDNFYHTDAANQELLGRPPSEANPGMASLIKGGTTGTPPDFATVILEHFNELIEKFEEH